nr:hypothetical protein [Tanacetum cinerariifolium]
MSGLVTHDLEGHEFEVWDGDCMMVVKEIVNRLLDEVEKLEWCFEQDIDDEEEKDEEGKGGSETIRRCFRADIKSWNEMIHHYFNQGYHPMDEIRMDDLEWWRKKN